MGERNAAMAPDIRIEFRIGIHQGDIVAEDGDIFGDGVNIAARLEGLAEPGGICVSARVQEDAAGKLDLAFRDLGEQQLKNIARPVRAYALRPQGHAALPATGLPAWLSRHGQAIIGTAAGFALVIVCIAWWFWFWPPSSGALDTASATPVP